MHVIFSCYILKSVMNLWKYFAASITAVITCAILCWRRRKKYKVFGCISKLFVYPVKSCAGIAIEEGECTELGFKYDRRWVIVDENGTFLTQRQEPSLALIQPSFEEEHLCLNASGMPTLKLNINIKDRKVRHIRIWRSYGEGMCTGAESARWISSYLDRPGCEIYFMTDGLKERRLIEDPKYTHLVRRKKDKAAFADWSPYMILSEASVADLNTRLSTPVTVKNYRPNIYVSGCPAYAEDDWEKLKIGNCYFTSLKHCTRCLLTTVNQETGVRDNPESLETLRSYRMHPNLNQNFNGQPCFGFNLGIDKTGTIKCGDLIFAIEKSQSKKTPWPRHVKPN